MLSEITCSKMYFSSEVMLVDVGLPYQTILDFFYYILYLQVCFFCIHLHAYKFYVIDVCYFGVLIYF